MTKIKNIIWDWNGTIVNDSWVFVDVMNVFLKKQGLPLTSLDEYKKNFCFPIQKYWKGLGFVFNDKEFNVINKKFIQQYQKKMFLPKLHHGIVSVINRINKKNFSQFVLSASEQSLLNKSIEHYKLASKFKGVFGVDNLNASGKGLLGKKLILKNKLNPNSTLLIGDTEYDWETARFLQCNVLLISHGHICNSRLKKTGCVVVKNIAELKRWLLINL